MPFRFHISFWRLLALGLVILVPTLNFVVYAKLNSSGTPGLSHSTSELVKGAFLFLQVVVVAPAFIAYRVITTPLKSAVLPIAYITCAVASYFTYDGKFNSHGADVSAISIMVSFVIFWIGAFFCFFPKWKQKALKESESKDKP